MQAERARGLGVAAVRRAKRGDKQLLFFFQAEDGIRDIGVTGVQTCALPILLRSYAATGRTVIVSSHLLSEIEQTCSHVVVMAKGQKIAQGTVEEIVGTGGAVLVGLSDEGQTEKAIAVLEGLPGVTAAQIGRA